MSGGYPIERRGFVRLSVNYSRLMNDSMPRVLKIDTRSGWDVALYLLMEGRVNTLSYSKLSEQKSPLLSSSSYMRLGTFGGVAIDASHSVSIIALRCLPTTLSTLFVLLSCSRNWMKYTFHLDSRMFSIIILRYYRLKVHRSFLSTEFCSLK